MSKRPSLANLGDRLSRKSGQAEDPAPTPAATSGAAPQKRAKSQPDGRKGILVRARPEAWRAMKLLALDGDKTLQDAMVEAMNDYLQKPGRPPVA